eukprot:3451142-Rhodomonas_salina.1
MARALSEGVEDGVHTGRPRRAGHTHSKTDSGSERQTLADRQTRTDRTDRQIDRLGQTHRQTHTDTLAQTHTQIHTQPASLRLRLRHWHWHRVTHT